MAWLNSKHYQPVAPLQLAPPNSFASGTQATCIQSIPPRVKGLDIQFWISYHHYMGNWLRIGATIISGFYVPGNTNHPHYWSYHHYIRMEIQSMYQLFRWGALGSGTFSLHTLAQLAEKCGHGGWWAFPAMFDYPSTQTRFNPAVQSNWKIVATLQKRMILARNRKARNIY